MVESIRGDSRKKSQPLQSEFFALPTFSEKIIEGHSPVLRTRERTAKEVYSPAIRVRVSSLMQLVPWYFYKIDRLRPLVEMPRSPEKRQAQLGIWLHQIDSLYRSIIHGYTGSLVHLSFPSLEPEARLKYEHALRDVELPDDAGETKTAQTLIDAYKIFRGQPGFVPPSPLTLPGFDVPDARGQIQTIFSSDANQRAQQLALAWAHEVTNNRSGLWLFRRDVRSEGEARVIVNFLDDLKLQFSGQLDSISWIPSSHQRIVTQVVDLKTGWPREPNEVFEETTRFQAWMIMTLGERYTVAKLAGSEAAKREGSTYVFPPTHIDNREFNGRTRFDYRVLREGETEFSFYHHGFTSDERGSYADMLRDLDQVIHENETEARKLMSLDIQFDLNRARLRPL